MTKKRITIIVAVIISIALLLIIILAMKKPKETKYQPLGSTYIPGQDDQTMLNDLNQIQLTEQGVYYISHQGKLWFYDEKSKISTPVCSKLNCKHEIYESTGCNALFPDFTTEIKYYNEKLYMIGKDGNFSSLSQKYSLYEISKDGSKRKKLGQMIVVPEDADSYTSNWSVHRGYCFYSISYNTSDNKEVVTLNQMSLDGTDRIDEITRFEGIGASISGINGYGDNIYYVKSKSEDLSYDTYSIGLYKYDLVTKQEELVIDKFYGYYFISNDVIYYDQYGTLVAYNMMTKEEQTLYEFPKDYGPWQFDGTYFYIDNFYEDIRNGLENREIQIVNTSGELVDKINPLATSECFFGDEKYLYFRSINLEGTEPIRLARYAKNQITTGDESTEVLMEE